MKLFKGNTFTDISGMDIDSEEIIFTDKNGNKIKMHHRVDCCESVYLEDINGKLEHLLNSEILYFREKSKKNEDEYCHQTFTFYTISTIKGTVDLRWNGESNGYYSESVAFDLNDESLWYEEIE
jgi:hypothetical protein